MSKTLTIKTSKGTVQTTNYPAFPKACPECGLPWYPFTGANGCSRAFCDQDAAQAYETLPGTLEPVQTIVGRIPGIGGAKRGKHSKRNGAA